MGGLNTVTINLKRAIAQALANGSAINDGTPYIALYYQGSVVKTIYAKQMDVKKDTANSRVVLSIFFEDTSASEYDSDYQQLYFSKGGAAYIACEANVEICKTSAEPLPLRWEIYFPYVDSTCSIWANLVGCV